MGIAIPQVITSSKASGAQVIDGSLKFDDGKKNYLKRDPGSAGDRQTFTWSGWIKRSSTGAYQVLFGSYSGSDDFHHVRFTNSETLETRLQVSNTDELRLVTDQVFRDLSSGWYHIVFAFDSTESTNSDKAKLYVNGSQITDFSTETYPSGSPSSFFSSTTTQSIGRRGDDNFYHDGSMSQVYFIDGQALGPEYFGYTDGLTNTWKPKKYVNTTASHGDVGGVVGFGTNGFYLPFDGSAPIGQDQSGQGNDFTPVNFGGSVSFDNPQVSGARPILNTTQGGTQAGVGVFGSKQNVGYAVTVYNSGGGNKYYLDGVEAPTLTGLIRGVTYTFDQSDSTNSTHPLVFGTTAEGNNFNGATVTSASAGSAGAATTITIPYDAPNTIYYHCSAHSGMGADITGITTNEKLADQYASNCVLAVTFANGNATVPDVSPSIACTATAHTLTKQGDPVTNTSANFYSSSVDFDGTGDYYKSASSSDFAFGTGDFTIEYWIDSDDLAGNQYGHLQISSSSTGLQENYTAGLAIYESPNAGAIAAPGLTGISIPSTGRLIKAGVWNHIALVREGTNARIYINGFLADSSTDSKDITGTYLGVGGYYNTNYLYNGRMQDLRIYKGAAKYNGSFEVPVTSPYILPDTPSGVSGSSKLTKITDGAVNFGDASGYLSLPNTTDVNFGDGAFTWECFAYFTSVSGSVTVMGQWENGSSRRSWLIQVNDGKMQSYVSNSGNSGADAKQADSPANYMAANRWYHIAVTRSGNNMRLFIDGELITTTDLGTFTVYANTDDAFQIGAQNTSGSHKMKGSLSDVRILKGTALYTSNFTPPTAPLTNITNTKLLCCQSPTSATEGAVKPGTITANGDAAATNFTPFNTDINTVRGQETGYATWNPLKMGTSDVSMSEGNLFWRTTSNGPDRCTYSTIGMDSGKFYWENEIVEATATAVGIANVLADDDSGPASAHNWMYYSATGQKYIDGTGSTYGDAYNTNGTIIGVAFDRDNLTLEFYKNGVSQGKLTSISGLTDSETYFAMCGDSGGASQSQVRVNFGQKPFKFPPPDGFQPLNIANTRPVDVISRPDQFVGITTWTGNSTDDRQINTGFRPDLVWTKRTDSALDHIMWDSVRGASSELYSNQSYAQGTATNKFGEFNDFGFTIKNNSAINQTGNWVSWNWKAGGNKNNFNIDDVGYATTTASGLTAGDSSSVTGCSIGTKQGFSIVRYSGSNSGQQIPHGLGHTPDLCIIKNVTTDSTNWIVSAGNENGPGGQFSDNVMLLNSTNANNTGLNGYWNTTNANSTVVYVGGNQSHTNKSGSNYIMYNWINVPGLQKFGTYEGNEDTGGDGPFVELGFRPAIIWIKNSEQGTSAADWVIYDSERNKFNPSGKQLYPNRDIAQADDSNHYFDILSNGFKVRSTSTSDLTNATDKYIYCAWAEAPSVDLYGGGANAR